MFHERNMYSRAETIIDDDDDDDDDVDGDTHRVKERCTSTHTHILRWNERNRRNLHGERE